MDKHGVQADVRCSAVDSEHNALLSLQKALEDIRSDKNLIHWSCGDSIFKLIIILRLPIMKEALEFVGLVAQNTQKLNEVICLQAKDGKLVELAVLLMVAREKVMEPITFQGFDDISSGRSMTLREFVVTELADHVGSEYKGQPADVSAWLHYYPDKYYGFEAIDLDRIYHEEMEAAMTYTLLLLEIFERAGDTIEAYSQLERTHASKEQVIQEVAGLLAEVGFTLHSEDTDLSDIVDCDPVPYENEESDVEEPSKCEFECQHLSVPCSQPGDSFSRDGNPINGVQDKLRFTGARNYGSFRGFQRLNAIHSEAPLCARVAGKGHDVARLPSPKGLVNCISLIKRGLKLL